MRTLRAVIATAASMWQPNHELCNLAEVPNRVRFGPSKFFDIVLAALARFGLLVRGPGRRRMALRLASFSWVVFAWPATAYTAALETGPMMSVPRMGHYIVELPDGRVALLGGHGTGFVALDSLDLWSPANNTFASVGIPFIYDMGALIPLADGSYLMAGGAADLGVAPGYASAQILDPANATVASTGTTMTLARMFCKGVQLTGGKVLIVGGWYDLNSATYGEVFNLSSKAFTPTGALNTPRSLPLVFPTSDGRAVVVGGTDSYGNVNIPSIEIYDPTTNTFTMLAARAIAGETNWVYAAKESMARMSDAAKRAMVVTSS